MQLFAKKIELKFLSPKYCTSALLSNAGAGYLKISRCFSRYGGKLAFSLCIRIEYFLVK